MSTSRPSPAILIGGGSVGGANGENDPNELAQIYRNLLSDAADIQYGPTGKVLVMGSGAIGLAGSIQAQVGAETPAEVANNLALLGSIAAYCKANSIGIDVVANLTNPATCADGTNALVDQWATAAAVAGLPIVSVADVQEIGFSNAPSTFAFCAATEVNAVKTIARDYAGSSYSLNIANLTVGDMEDGNASGMTNIGAWWAAYNSAAASAGVQGFSYAIADTSWNAPWIATVSTSVWQSYLVALSSLCVADHMALDVDMEGIRVDTSGSQSVAQVEQHAAQLAGLVRTGAINVAALQFQSWQSLPYGIGAITSPTSQSNLVAEIGATFPLYQAGSITAAGSVVTSAPGQVLVKLGVATSLIPLSITWSTQDVLAGNRLGVVLIDQTGTLSATSHGSGSVLNDAPNILVLNGNSADLAAELASVRLTEGYAGPDTLDIETFGAAGRLSDNQINLLAVQSGQGTGTITVDATSNSQGWLSASVFVNAGSVITSETLNWSTTGTLTGTIAGAAPGQSAFVKEDAVHEPLAEYGVENATTIGGVAINAVADVNDPTVDNGNGIAAAGGAANNIGQNVTVGLTAWLRSFDPASQAVMIPVISTTNTFSPGSGRLQSSTDILAPDPLTVVNLGGTAVPNTFATQFNSGGTQAIEWNTGDNPGWQAAWGNQFNSATLTYDSAGHLVEEFLQGGPANPAFTIDDVFDPNSGRLWEEFQSTSPPPASSYSNPVSNYVTGPLYITQFNTGNNPNWDYLDWGTASPVDTEIWTDYFVMQNMSGFFTSNAPYSYTYEFVNGSTLDLLNLPGSIVVNLNALRNVTLDSQSISTSWTGLNAIDAGGATGVVVLTGLASGGSTLIGGDNQTTITAYGHDTIVAGSGATTITTGTGGSTILMAGTAGGISVTGNSNMITDLVAGTSVAMAGNANTVTAGAGVAITATTVNKTLTVNGSRVTITAAAGDTITATGQGDTIYASGGTIIAGTATTGLAITGSNNTVSAAAGDSITFNGTAEVVNGSSITVTELVANAGLTVNGNGVTVTAAAGDTVTLTGTADVATFINGGVVTLGSRISSATVTGNHTTVWMNPNGGTITLVGSNDTVTAGGSAIVTVIGNSNVVGTWAGDTVTVSGQNDVIYASGDTITAGAATTGLLVAGSNNTVSAAAGDSITFNGTAEVVNGSSITVTELVANAGLTVNGSRVTITAAAGDTITTTGTADVINFLNGGTLIQANATASATIYGNNITTRVMSTTGSIIAVGSASAGNQIGNTVTVSGRNDYVYASGIAILAAPATTGLTVIGNGNTLSGSAGDSMTLNGIGDVVNASSITVSVATAAAAIINGNNDTISLAQGSTATLGGSSTSTTVKGSGVLINQGVRNTVTLTPQGTLTVAAGASLSASITSGGTIDLTSGTLVVPYAFNQSDTFLLDGAATLNFNAAVGNAPSIRFIQSGGTLETQATGPFAAPISGFAHGDTIDVASVLFSLRPSDLFKPAIGNASGILTLNDGIHAASFVMLGTYTPTAFHLLSDGHGGTAITYS